MHIQREGWLGTEYVRVYAQSDRVRVAELYDFSRFLPGYEPLGSWGLDALCLAPDSRIYIIDWIPLHESFRKQRYASKKEFESDIERMRDATPEYEHFQKEVHFVKPIVFGGDPKAKPIMIEQSAHAELCRFWNQTYARLKDVKPWWRFWR